jgi:hypothetical protein
MTTNKFGNSLSLIANFCAIEEQKKPPRVVFILKINYCHTRCSTCKTLFDLDRQRVRIR